MAVSLQDRAPFELINRAISVPAGQGSRYAPWQFTALAALLEARDRASKPPAVDLDKPFGAVWPAARRLIADSSAVEAERVAAAQLIGYGARRDSKDRDLLLGLLRPQVSVQLQQAAVTALGRTDDPKLADILFRDWKGYSPKFATRSSTRSSAERRGHPRCSPVSKTAAFPPPRSIRPAGSSSSAVEVLRSGPEPRLYSRTRPSRGKRSSTHFARAWASRATQPPARLSSRSFAFRAIAWGTKGLRSAPTSPP